MDVVLHAVRALANGEVVAIPTDTVYGLAAALDQPAAIERLYTLKGRSAEKAIPILIADPVDVDKLTPDMPAMAMRLADAFWPGALTLVLRALPDLPDRVKTPTADGITTVAVRVPDNRLARAVIATAGGALAVTSANRSGAAPALDASEVGALGLPGPLFVVDGGRAPGGTPSTIVLATGDAPEIIRQGAIPISAISAVLGDRGLATGDTPAQGMISR